MAEQSYSNHSQRVPVFLGVALILLLSFIGACVILYHSFNRPAQHHVAMLIAAVCFACMVGFFQCRTFALKVQDRAIRAEENLRHFAMAGKLLDSRLTLRQIIAVRFASDDQFVELAREAAEKGLPPDAIKKAVKQWRPDLHRA
ncbi:MAG TPA: DUF6526 family protein [Bryobacteraceae bacterium]|jgi:hypothetical protein|nr:DUF6526 family protein [Bryobacteraceae bacterium]